VEAVPALPVRPFCLATLAGAVFALVTVAPVIPRLLRENANFRRYFIGQSISLFGDQVSLIALPLTAVLALHASAAQMGALTTAYLVPNLLLSLHAGVWVDRRGRRRQTMLAADLVRALLTVSIPLAYAFWELTWTHLYVAAFLLGSASVFFQVAYSSFFQAVVPREHYVQANSLLNGTRGFSFLAGTSLGGVLVQLLRGPYALAVDAGSFIWSAAFLRRMDVVEPPGAEPESGGVTSGLRWIRNNAIMRAQLLGVATLNLFNFIFFALFMLYATRTLGVSPATLGIVLGTAASSTLVASYLTGRIARRIGIGPAFIVGCFVFPAPLVFVPAAAGPHWLVVAFLFAAEFLSGLGLMLLDILGGTISAAVIPVPLRSRVQGAFLVVNYGVRPVGTVLGGVLGTVIGVRPALWIATVGALAGLFWLLPSPIRTLRDVPEEAAT
jgi:MFS family permease